MSSKTNRVVPISTLKAIDVPTRPPSYSRLDELLEARRLAAEALDFISAPGSTGEYLKLLEEGQQTFRAYLEQICQRLDSVLFFDHQCDTGHIAPEHVSLIDYVRSTVLAFCNVANSFTTARNIRALQIDNANDGWRTVMEAIHSLERLARRSLAQLLAVGPERIIPRG
jgi:hypothetical protein